MKTETRKIIEKMFENDSDEHIIELCEEFLTVGKLIYAEEVEKEMHAGKQVFRQKIGFDGSNRILLPDHALDAAGITIQKG